jgi:hypothetical protein
VDAEAVVRRRLILAVCGVGLTLAALTAGPTLAADECDGLRVCLPVTGPWVVVPAGGVDYELSCPLAGYIVAGIDARVADRDVDVSFRGEPGSPVGPGVTTRASVVFHAERARVGGGASSFQPFIGCIPTSGGGGRALTGVTARTAGIKPIQPLRSVVVDTPLRTRSSTVRVVCPSGSKLVGSTSAAAFRQTPLPSRAQLGAVRVQRVVVDGAVVARVSARAAAGRRAEVQVRAVCASVR